MRDGTKLARRRLPSRSPGEIPDALRQRPGRHQNKVIDWVLARGGKAIRTGLEANIRLTRDRLTSSYPCDTKVSG
jgi:hypothetical protein